MSAHGIRLSVHFWKDSLRTISSGCFGEYFLMKFLSADIFRNFHCTPFIRGTMFIIVITKKKKKKNELCKVPLKKS